MLTDVLAVLSAAQTTPCTSYRPVDVVFVLASDLALGADNWLAVQQFASSIVAGLNVGESATRSVQAAQCVLSVSVSNHHLVNQGGARDLLVGCRCAL